MHNPSFSGLSRALHPERNRRSPAERISQNLASCNFGLKRTRPENAAAAKSALDSFSVTKNISELLSPACGMTEEEKREYLAHILARLKSGEKLSGEEMRFLQAEDPVLYQQAARVQTMRDSLETRLAGCTSKEEASEVYADALSSISSEDPMKEYLVAAYQKVMDEFQQSDEYQALPQEKEDAEVR